MVRADKREHDFSLQPAIGCFFAYRRHKSDDFPVPGSLLLTRYPGRGAKGLTLVFFVFPKSTGNALHCVYLSV